jgi:hypothetical protein
MNTIPGLLTDTGTYLFFWYQEGVRSVAEFNRRLAERPNLFGNTFRGTNVIGFEIILMMRNRGITPPTNLGLVP